MKRAKRSAPRDKFPGSRPIDPLPGDYDNLIKAQKPIGLFSYWVSNLEPIEVAGVAQLLPNEGNFLEIRALTSPETYAVNSKIFPIYDVDEDRYSAAIGEIRPALKGRYLRILIGTDATLNNEFANDLLLRTANRVRMIRGVGAASEEIQRVRRNIVSDTCSMTDSMGIWGPLARNDLSSILDLDDGIQREFRMLRTENWVHRAIQSAVSAKENETRFIFLWIIFEGIVGGGFERSEFFLKELGSERLNELGRTLFETRNRIFHEAKLEEGISCVMQLLELVRIALLPSGQLRSLLAKRLEDSLPNGK